MCHRCSSTSSSASAKDSGRSRIRRRSCGTRRSVRSSRGSRRWSSPAATRRLSTCIRRVSRSPPPTRPAAAPPTSTSTGSPPTPACSSRSRRSRSPRSRCTSGRSSHRRNTSCSRTTAASSSSGPSWSSRSGSAPRFPLLHALLAQSQVDDSLQQLRIRDSAGLRGRREFLAFGDFGSRIGFQEIELPVAPEAEIDARVAAQLQNLVDALAHVDEERFLLRRELGSADVDAVARLILDVVLDLGGRDEGCVVGELLGDQLPRGERDQPLVSHHAHVQLAPLDELLRDGVGADPLVDEAYAFGELFVRIDDRRLCDAHRRVLDERLHDERKGQARRTLYLPPHREHRELGNANAVIEQELLRERLAARDDHAARIASRVGNLQQLEEAHDVLVEEDFAVELLQKIEHDVRFPFLDGVTDREQFVLHAERTHLVTDRAKVADDVVLRLPDVDLLFGVPVECVGRHELRMHQRENSQALHTAIQSRRPCCAMNSIVRAVRSTMKSVSSCRSRPPTRSLSSRQRPIMSPSTVSSVNWYSPVHFDTTRRTSVRWRRRKLAADSCERWRGACEKRRSRSSSYVSGYSTE